MRKIAVWTLVGLALFAAACSGAHQSLSPTPPSMPQSPDRNLSDSTSALSANDDLAGPLVAVTASVIVTVPTSASAAKSISIKVNTGTPVIANLSSTSPGCSGTNPVVCTLLVSATTGSDVFALKTFNGSNGTGTVLATGSVFQTITTTSKTVKITLAGTPKGITLALKRTGPFECNGSTTIQLFVMVMDSAANVIIGGYGESVALTDSDTSGKTRLAPTSVSSSASTVNVTYTGLPLVSAIFSASASGVPTSAIHSATLKPVQLMFVSEDQQFVAVYPPTANGSPTPLRSMNWSGLPNGLTTGGITIDSNCTLYVTNSFSGDVTGGPEIDKFPATASGSATPSAAIGGSQTHLGSSLVHVAVGAAGKIYVVNPAPTPAAAPAVEVFAAGVSGNVAPIATISGSNTGLTTPVGIAVDAGGKIYVTDISNSSVFVFATGANGNVSPVATISGPFTTFVRPTAVAIDSAGRIYVADPQFDCGAGGGGAIDVFAAGAMGNVAPIRQIAGSNTLYNGCYTNAGIAVDLAGNIYLAAVHSGVVPPYYGVDAVLVFSSSANGNVAPRQALTISNGYPGIDVAL